MFQFVTIGALVSTISVIAFLIVSLFGKTFLLSTSFSYSPVGDLTPTNSTCMQLYFTRGETYLDNNLQPSSSCVNSFTSLTCNLLTGSAILVGLGLLTATLALIFLCLSRKQGKSKIHGSYMMTLIVTVVLLLLAYVGSTTASSRLLNSELPQAQERSISNGIQKAVEIKVIAGINQNWQVLNAAADSVQWMMMYGAGMIKNTGCFNGSIPDTTILYACLDSEGRDVASLNETGYVAFHNISVVKAFNKATNMSLPDTVFPSAIRNLIEKKAYEIGNMTFRAMKESVEKSVHDNIVMTTGMGFAFLIAALIASAVAMLMEMLVFRQRYTPEIVTETNFKL